MHADKETLQHNIDALKERMAQAAIRAGRKLEDITLVAASKMNDAETVKCAAACGISVMGENRVQELLEKYEAGAYENVDLQFIGTLQTNKVKYLMGKVSLIQSVGSIKLGQAIAKEAAKHGICQDILLEVNIGREASKSGLDPDTLETAISELAPLSGISIKGLMAIPPISTMPGKNICYFDEMHQLFVDISEKKYDNVSMVHLSMGMSGDFEDAIACGSTMIRVGTAIFGSRPYLIK